MKIGESLYTSDLIIFPDRIKSSWWRKTGHRLCLGDLREVFEEDFDLLIVGTGYWGMMKVDKEVIQHVKSAERELIIEKTTKAVEKYNALSHRKKTVAAFHLTC